MSQLTDYAENKLADMVRGQAWALPATVYIGLASAATDAAVTELTGTGYARVGLTRNLTNWAGTQAPASTLASSGTSHASSNNVALSWGTSGSAWGTASHAIAYDAATGGNAIAYFPLPSPLVIGNAQPVSIAIGGIGFTLGLSGGCSDYLCNKLIDFIFRGQAFSFPATLYNAYLTATPNNAGGGTEVGGGVGYARVAIAGSLTALSGTQGAGSTVASTGSGGVISNNAPITQAAALTTGAWGTLTATAEYDAASTGNLIFWAPLNAPKTVPSSVAPPAFAAGTRTITFA